MFCCKKKNKTEAQVVDNALVVSVAGAELPRVWRADMSRFSLATLEVQEAAGKFKLVIKTDSASEDIAVFAAKQDAIDAMQAVKNAMLNGASGKRSCGTGSSCGGIVKKFFKCVGILLAIFIVLMILVNVFGAHSAARTAAGPQAGTPLPAEQIFGATPADNGK